MSAAEETVPEKGTLSAMRAGSLSSTTKGDIAGYFICGIILLVIGGGIMGLGWPSMEPNSLSFLDDEPAYVESGSWGVVFVGACLATAGQIVVAVATIASGIRLGLRRD